MLPIRTLLTRFFLAAVFGAGLAAFVPPAGAAPMPGHGPHGGLPPPHAPAGGELPPPPYLHGLQLSEAQQDKVFAILHALAPQLREQAKLARKAEEELRELARGEQYDEGRARALAEAGARAQAEMALLRSRADRQIHALLTPEQKQAAADGKNCRRPGNLPEARTFH